MNGERYVAEKTSERVREAAETLDYHPDLLAGNLRRTDRRTGTIGLLVSGVDNPFSSVIHRMVEDVAREHSAAVIASSIDNDPLREREVVAALTRRRVDGLIMMPAAESQAYLGPHLARGMSFVFVDREPVGFAADSVVADNLEGASRAVRHLLSYGHRRIAFLGDLPTLQTMQARKQGYLDELSRGGVQADSSLVAAGLHGSAAAREATLHMMRQDDPPTAIFSAQNLVTVGVLQALHELGQECDVALVGFDDVLLGDMLKPGLTVIAQDPRNVGRIAAERLFARLDGNAEPPAKTVLRTTLIERGSGEIPSRNI